MNEGNYSQVLYAEDQEMFDFNFIKNLSLKIGIKRSAPEPNVLTGNEERDSLWHYLTGDLEIKTGKDKQYAIGMFDLGWKELTSPAGNLLGEITEAERTYEQTRDNLSKSEAEEVEHQAESVILVRKWGESDFAKIDEEKLSKIGVEVEPILNLALSQKARVLRAQRQLALQTTHEYYRDYTDLRERLKGRPPISEVEQELPFFWTEMRRVLR